MRSHRYFFLCILFSLATTSLLAGETVTHPKLGFRLTVPDGFNSDPERVQGAVIYAFQHPPSIDQKIGTFILVSGLGGVLNRKKIDPKTFATKNPQIRIVTEQWKDFDIEVFRVPEQKGELSLLTFNAQAPLKPEAIQVTVIGDATYESELQSVLRSVLRSLDGPTNWLNTQERSNRLTEGLTRLAITVIILLIVGIGVILVIAFIVWQILRKRKVDRGNVE